MGLFSKKSFADLQAEADGGQLRRSLGPWHLTALGIGSIIGTGIFVLTGTAASQNAGPALVLSMIISAVGCAFSGLCYAEFAAMVPVAGSAYTYAYATIGEFVAWIIGWDLILEYALSVATVAVGWSGYFVSFARDCRHRRFRRRSTSPPPDGLFNLPAALIVLVVAGAAGDRHQAVGRHQHACWWRSRPSCWSCSSSPARRTCRRANLTPFIPPNTGAFGAVRLERRAARRRRDVLRLHRLRRRLDRGAGGEQPGARHADRHPRVARDLHGHLHRSSRSC